MNRCELLAERANKLSQDSKKALRYLLPSKFPYQTDTFLITEDSDHTYNLLLEQVVHLENLEASK
jgi:hypothetical protein